MVVPIIGLWVVPIGLLSSATYCLSPAVAGFLLSVGNVGLDLAISVVEFWSDISWSSVWVIRPSWLEIILVYGLLYTILHFSTAWTYKVLTAVLLAGLFSDMGYWVYQTQLNRDLRVTVLDVGKSNAVLIQFPGRERMLIEKNVFRPWGFNLSRIAIAPYLWHNKITRLDYIVPMDTDLPRSEKLRFMVDTFHVREILSDIPHQRVIHGATIRAERAGEVAVSYRAWSFLCSEAGVRIHKEKDTPGDDCTGCWIITNERKIQDSQGIRVAEAGAVTLSIDPNGSIRAGSFLQKNLPLGEGG
jgi:beta-lactamase superfamily II metal-dependent hydrolase